MSISRIYALAVVVIVALSTREMFAVPFEESECIYVDEFDVFTKVPDTVINLIVPAPADNPASETKPFAL